MKRQFSGLKFILNKQQPRLNRDIKNDIMIIQTNEPGVKVKRFILLSL